MTKMLLAMRVVYEGEEIKYDMSVGDGRMTIKWLGLAAAQHFSAKVKPSGYRRHREHTGPIRIISTSAKLLPCRVYTAQATFLHPEKSISEELTSGEEVFVELLNKIFVSQIGRPVRNRWMFIAFCTADQNAAERKKAIDNEYRAMEEAHAQQVRDAEAKAKDVAAKKGSKMRHVMSSQLYCSDKVEKAFEGDWAKLCHPVTMPMDKITEDLEEQSSVKAVVLAHYVTLVEVFKHYASVGSAVATGDLDIMEFSAFIHDLRGFGAAKSRDLVEKSFGEAISACSGDRGRSSTPAMGVVGFIFAVIWLACGRHHVSSGISAGDSASGGSKIKTASSVHEAVALFMEDVILPLAHRKVIGLQIKTALGSDDILALYHDNDARLQLVFDKYSKADDRAGGGTAALCVLLNIAEFRMLLRDAGLLGGNHNKGEDDELTVKEARQAFAGAQNDLCGGDASAAAPPLSLEVGAPVEQMTYPEFLEGIARVAMLKWEDATSTPKDKIERAIAATASLLHGPPSSTTS